MGNCREMSKSCFICGQEFPNRISYYLHVQKHAGKSGIVRRMCTVLYQIRRFALNCPVKNCTAVFSSRQILEIHMQQEHPGIDMEC